MERKWNNRERPENRIETLAYILTFSVERWPALKVILVLFSDPYGSKRKPTNPFFHFIRSQWKASIISFPLSVHSLWKEWDSIRSIFVSLPYPTFPSLPPRLFFIFLHKHFKTLSISDCFSIPLYFGWLSDVEHMETLFWNTEQSGTLSISFVPRLMS